MTSTEFNIGLDGTRVSSRVLRPPGGGSSDIFGLGSRQPATNGSEEKQNGQTTVTNTQNRLFGAQTETGTPAKSHVRSNVLERENNAAVTKSTKKPYVRRNPITGEEIIMNQDNGTENKDDKEETSTKEENGKEETDANQQNGNEVKKIEIPVKTIQTSIRIRNPPGGKSSGIF